MRVALCISGQSRFVSEIFPSIERNVILPNNADVFLHTWVADTTAPYKKGGQWNKQRLAEKAHETAIKLYKPKTYLIENDISFKNSKNNWAKSIDKYYHVYEEGYDKYLNKAMYSMWYSIMKSNELKEKYRLENDIHYDAVIRCRMDVDFQMPIICDQLDLNKISFEYDGRDNHINDWVAVGNNANMNIYQSTFNIIDKYIENNEIWCNEDIVTHHLKIHNIAIAKCRWGLSMPRFDVLKQD